MKLVLTTLNAKYTHSSLALRYLKKTCEGICETELLEFTINNQLLDMMGQIYEKQPTILGFACYIWNIELTKQLIALVHKVLPDCTIICGGPEVSYGTTEFMQEMEMVDYVIRGEGEEVLFRLLQRLRAGETEVGVPAGIACRHKGGTVEAGPAVTVGDFARIPFPYEENDVAELGEKILYYETSRGCPFACKYCLSCATWGVRYRPVEQVLAELAFFVQRDVRQVKFVDRTFNARKEHFLPILRFLAAQDCRTNFHFEVAVDYLDDEVLAVLRTMPPGRIQLEIGIQSTNEETLRAVSRVNHWAAIERNIRAILGFRNMHVHVDLIIGLPGEGLESLAESFNMVYGLQPDMLQIGFLKFLKGAAMMELVAEHGYIYMDKAPYQFLANRYLDYGQVRKLRTFETVFELYYNAGRFRQTVSYLIAVSGGNAYAFYDALTDFWEARRLHLIAHTAKTLYRYLADFCDLRYPERKREVLELLKFDALLSDGGSIRPDFLPWNGDRHQAAITDFWRNGVAEKYIEGYAFTNWRKLNKSYHIEVFPFAMEELRCSHAVRPVETTLLFDFTGKATKYCKIETGDLDDGI